MCIGSRVRLVGVSISFEKNFYQLPFTPPLFGSLYRSFTIRVDLPDGDYSLVPEAEKGGAEAALQYVEVLEDTEGAQASTADEGKPRCI
jgi:hypothetical protein